MLYCPDIPSFAPPKYYSFFSFMYFGYTYMIILSLAFLLYLKSNEIEDRFILKTLMIYVAGMFLFELMIINPDSIAYIKKLNSKPWSMAFSILLWSMVLLYKYLICGFRFINKIIFALKKNYYG
jgi:hypothetical protein